MDEPLLPWQAATWERLQAQIDAGKLPHALLVSGPADAGKHRLIEQLASYLLCQGETPVCGVCAQCLLMQAGTHPDYKIVSPEESKQIRIDQIRDLIDWAMQTAQQGGRKFCVIDPADKMNVQSANALLKVLEEPPVDTVLCLVTSQPSKILPTLRSRCQQVECVLPTKDEAKSWLSAQIDTGDPDLLLNIAEGNPLRAAISVDDDYLALRQDTLQQLVALGDGKSSPLEIAANLSKHDPEVVLSLTYQLIADSIRSTQTGGQVVRNSDVSDDIGLLAERDIDERFEMMDRVVSARGQLSGTGNPNPQMLLEWVLMG